MPAHELRRLRGEMATLRQELTVAKKGRCMSRKSRVQVRPHCAPFGRVPSVTHVPCVRTLGGRLLCLVPAPESWRGVSDDVVMAHVRTAFVMSGETYGAPRKH